MFSISFHYMPGHFCYHSEKIWKLINSVVYITTYDTVILQTTTRLSVNSRQSKAGTGLKRKESEPLHSVNPVMTISNHRNMFKTIMGNIWSGRA